MTVTDEMVEARDEAVTFVFEQLAAALGVTDWAICDGSETWEGDVSGTLYAILRKARVLDPETDEKATDRLAALEAAAPLIRAAVIEECAKAFQQNAMKFGRQECCGADYFGDGCCGNTVFMISDTSGIAAIRALARSKTDE